MKRYKQNLFDLSQGIKKINLCDWRRLSQLWYDDTSTAPAWCLVTSGRPQGGCWRRVGVPNLITSSATTKCQRLREEKDIFCRYVVQNMSIISKSTTSARYKMCPICSLVHSHLHKCKDMVLGFNLNSTTAALLATSVATDLIALLQLLT